MVTSVPSSDTKSSFGFGVSKASARLFGSTLAGVMELLVFHPVDTIAKRLMNNQETVFGVSGYSKVIFRGAYDKPLLQRYGSLFPGLGFAAAYKISQRIYKFGGQPVVVDFLKGNFSGYFHRQFGDRNAKPLMHAVAGSMIGVGEIILLPLDVLKIRAQTNPKALGKRGVTQIFQEEGFALYRGAGWTAARNAPGSFALFGGSALCKEYMFGLTNFNDATFFQNFVASTCGASASILSKSRFVPLFASANLVLVFFNTGVINYFPIFYAVSQPLDVVKTRVQSRSFESPEPGMTVVRNLLKGEGASALFKGVIPKLIAVGPKLVFSFTVAQHVIAFLEKMSK
jgi:hypothetical protein